MRPRNVFFKKSITNIRKNIYKQEKKNNYFKNYDEKKIEEEFPEVNKNRKNISNELLNNKKKYSYVKKLNYLNKKMVFVLHRSEDYTERRGPISQFNAVQEP